MTEIVPIDQLSDVARALKLTFDTGDRGPWEDLMAPECVNWHNSDKRVFRSIGSNGTAALRSAVVNCRADVVQAERFENGGELISLIIRGTVSATGKELAAHNCVVVTKDDAGKIVRIDDYVDPGLGDAFEP